MRPGISMQMAADRETLMNADKRDDYLYKELTYKIRGAFFEVYNT